MNCYEHPKLTMVAQCPDCGKKRVRPADEQEPKEYLDRRKHTEKWNRETAEEKHHR